MSFVAVTRDENATSSPSFISSDAPMITRRTRARPTEILLFFLSGVGASIAWTSVLSNLVYYTEVLGTKSYLCLNLAIYFPLLPITVAQARWDAAFDKEYGSMNSFSFRGFAAFAATSLMISVVPFASQNLWVLSMLSMILGTASAVLYGTLNQMASFVYPGCGRLPAAATSGIQASGLIVLTISLSTGFGSSGASTGIVIFYLSIALVVGACWTAFLVLMARSRQVRKSMLRRDSFIGGAAVDTSAVPLLADKPPVAADPLQNKSSPGFENRDENRDDSKVATEMHEATEYPSSTRSNFMLERELSDLSYGELWKKTRTHCISLFVTVSSSMSVASWFNQVKSANPSNNSLPQVLFFVRLFADLAGRPMTIIHPPKSVGFLAISAVLRLLFVPLFFIYVSIEDFLPRNDALLVFGVAAFAFTSGYIVTGCYQLAPPMLSDAERDANVTKQAGLINIFFSTSVLLGLTVSLILLGTGL